jgi:hypothetical protein
MRGTQRGRTLSRSMRAAALAVFGIGAHGPAAHADPPGQAAAPRSAASQGITMIAVTTSAAQPDSKVMLQSLRVHPWLVANAQRIKLVEIAGETQANSAARVGLSVCPSVIAYSQGANGVEVIGGRSGFGSANDAVEWLRSLEQRTVDSRRAVSDPNVALTMLDKCPPYASQQGYAPPASVPQAPLTPASVPPLPTTPASTPMMYTPVTTTTASVVQAPAQNFVIQQQPAQVFFAPQAAATIYVPQSVAPAPTAPSNLFMPAAVPPLSMPASTAPASVPMTMAPASVPMATVPAAMVPTASQPVGLTTQSVSVPASRTSSRVRVRGPGPLARMASRLGEQLTLLGRTRIQTVQETQLETQTTQTPPGQFMTLSSTSATPTMPPQHQTFTPASVPPAPPQEQQPPCPAPSPQSPSKHSWFGN